MEHDAEETVRTSQTAFVGRIIASFTHELRNHLAVIGESAGLQQDMISLGGKSKLDASEYVKFLKDMEAQVQKALKLISYLNRYAHRMDFETSDFSVNEAMEELAALISRFAYQRKITLETEFSEDLPTLRSNPARLQLATYCLFDHILKSLSRKGSITLKTAATAGAVTVSLIPRGTPAENPEAGMCTEREIEEVLSSIGGTLTRGGDESVTVRIPLTGNAGEQASA